MRKHANKNIFERTTEIYLTGKKTKRNKAHDREAIRIYNLTEAF